MCSRDSSSNAVMRVSMSFGEIDDNLECIFHANIFLYAQDEWYDRVWCFASKLFDFKQKLSPFYGSGYVCVAVIALYSSRYYNLAI